MNNERTLSIIKPDGIKKKIIGNIISCFEINNFSIVAAKMKHLSTSEAKLFYSMHKEKKFFLELINFISSMPILILVLQSKNVIQKHRELIGSTNYIDASYGTIRRTYASSLIKNIIHGSDSVHNAKKEINF